jgi:heme a synthase
MTDSVWNLAPSLQIMLLGLVIALGPLSWVWLRSRQQDGPRRLQQLTLLTLFLTFDLVIFGAFTRLSDSGLGCPDWPGCYGSVSPVGAQHAIAAAQQALPDGPVTFKKAWIEMVHRYLATAVGVLILTLLLAAWQQRREQRRLGQPATGLLWPAVTLLWVCMQGAFGALTVTMKLFPAIVTLHLLGGLGLLLLLCAQVLRQRALVDQQQAVLVSPRLRLGMAAVAALLLCQLALGGWVSTNYAVLACQEFPLCQGSLWPAMNFPQGFEIWRALGVTAEGNPIDFSALTAIHYTHRLMAYVLFVALGWLAWRLYRLPGLQLQSKALLGLALWQAISGLSNVVLGWPLVAALAHTAGAAGLVLAMTWAWCGTRTQHRPVDVHRPSTGGRTNGQARWA